MFGSQRRDFAARLWVVGDQQHIGGAAHRARQPQRGPGTAHPAGIDDQRRRAFRLCHSS